MGFSLIKVGNKVGLVKENQDIILPIEYDNIVFDFQEEFALTRKDGKWGIASKEGYIICECIYDTIHLDFVTSYYACVGNTSKDGVMLYGLINQKGELTCGCQYDYIDPTPIAEDRFIVGMFWIDEGEKQKKLLSHADLHNSHNCFIRRSLLIPSQTGMNRNTHHMFSTCYFFCR